MARTVISNFGGIMPAFEPRALPGAAAQVARNLLSSVDDFRPLNDDVVVASGQSPSDAITMYRIARKSDGSFNTDMSMGWTLRAGPVSFVKGPLNLDDTERTYLTFDDDTGAPRWIDTTGENRLLGVPRPTVAAVATPVVVDEFTTEERASAITAVTEEVMAAIRASLIVNWMGAPEPGSGTQGWVNYQADMTAPASQGYQVRAWRTTSINGARNGSLSNSYSAVGVENFSWVFDAALQPFWETSTSESPVWQGGGPGNYYDHICLAVPAYGITYDINDSALSTALSDIDMPGTDDGTKFLTPEQVTYLVARVVDYADQDGAIAKPKLDNLRNKYTEVKTLLDGGLQGAAVATMQGFYAKAAITSIVTNELTSWAGALWDAIHAGYTSTIPTTSYTPGDAGP